MDHAEKIYRARRKVEAITGFYIHAGIYVIVNAGLLLIDLLTGPEWWVQWPLLGWGIGIVAHGAVVYVANHPRVIAWEQRKLAEIEQELTEVERTAPDLHRPTTMRRI